MTQHQVEIAKFNSDYHKQARELRAEVLRKPLGLPANDPAFNDKETDVHFVALKDEQVVGIVVLVPNYKPSIGKLRQMATAEEVRGEGYGVALVKALEEYAVANGMIGIKLHSRHYAIGFYEKLGYEITSDVFQEVGMDHFILDKKILKSRLMNIVKIELDNFKKEYKVLSQKHMNKGFSTELGVKNYVISNQTELERLKFLIDKIYLLKFEMMTDKEYNRYHWQWKRITDKHSLE